MGGWVDPYRAVGSTLVYRGPGHPFSLPSHAEVEPRTYPYLDSTAGLAELGLPESLPEA